MAKLERSAKLLCRVGSAKLESRAKLVVCTVGLAKLKRSGVEGGFWESEKVLPS